jgi:hypothetical protein
MLKPVKYTTLSPLLAAGTEAKRKFVGEEGVNIRKGRCGSLRRLNESAVATNHRQKVRQQSKLREKTAFNEILAVPFQQSRKGEELKVVEVALKCLNYCLCHSFLPCNLPFGDSFQSISIPAQ